MLLMAFGVSGCANKVVTTPPAGDHGNATAAEKLRCKVRYDGNPEYLPGSVVDSGDQADGITAEYAYEIIYNGSKPHTELLVALVPTTLIGTPTGRDILTAISVLRVSDKTGEIKQYYASCEVTFYRGVFAGAVNFTKMRKDALLEVKKSIESQMYCDHEFIAEINRRGGTQ